MLFWIPVGLACEPLLLSRFQTPTEPPAERVIQTTTGSAGGANYVGAQVTFRSSSSPRDWQRVLEHPELQDEWHPKELGTERVERIQGTDFYQRTGISVLGTFTIRRQLIPRIRWLEMNDQILHTCWYAGNVEEFREKVKAWDDGSPWQERGYGGWTVRALAGGGSVVAYQVWVNADMVPSSFVSWAVTRTLPKLLGAFDARVAELALVAAGKAGSAPTP
ncbi:MAG TPA: hypothetical protein PLA94_21455 [Myxococcota bacterium]|nr:hypothetical protein [Myxococcota bacterium]